MTRTSRTLVALALAVSLAACGGDEDDPTLTQPSPSAPTTAPPTEDAPTEDISPAAEPVACESRPPTAEPPAGAVTDLGTKPAVQPDDAPPPCGLVTRDIVVGDGAEASAGDTVEVKYVGAFYETGEEFDSSWGSAPGDAIEFSLDQVIPGFSEGIVGMKVGGRRQITVPSDLGYGPEGSPPTIPPDSTLVFVVDLVGVTPA